MSEQTIDIFNQTEDQAKSMVQNEKRANDGLYRIDLDKASGSPKVYRARLRLLPNISNDGKASPVHWVEKIMHYVKVPIPDLRGYIDSPKSINEKCELTNTYWTLKKHDDPVMQQKADMLSYVRRYYSYVLVIEDKQQPELEGKILVWSYGKKIFDKIKDMHEGNMTGNIENVFDLGEGHDLMLNVKEVAGYTNYDSCAFDVNRTSILVPHPKKEGEMVRVPTEEVDGKQIVSKKAQKQVLDMLTTKEVDLAEYEYQPIDANTQAKINRIINYLTNSDTSVGGSSIDGQAQASASAQNSVTDADSFFDDVNGEGEVEESSFDTAFDDDSAFD